MANPRAFALAVHVLATAAAIVLLTACQPEQYLENKLDARLEGTAPGLHFYHGPAGQVTTCHQLGGSLSHCM